jgi:tRNA threonylcarbamoyladenosine biosynthesis protein TsaB
METFPMNTLAIDTITPALSVTASGKNGRVTISILGGGQHATPLVDVMNRAISLAGFEPRETGLVTCAEGPGSFTGLRLAWSSAKAISLASLCPLVPAPPLSLYAAPFSSWPGAVISVLDAKKNRFYAQAFRNGSAVTEALDIDPSTIRDFTDPEERILVTGPDADTFKERVDSAIPGLSVTSIPYGVGGISAEMAEFAEKAVSGYTEACPDHAGPVYVRKSDAENDNI